MAQKHIKTSLVDDVMIIKLDSPGVKVNSLGVSSFFLRSNDQFHEDSYHFLRLKLPLNLKQSSEISRQIQMSSPRF